MTRDAIQRITAEWGDAVAAIQSSPGAPDYHDVGRAIAMGDLMVAALRSRPAPPDDLERKHRVPDDVMMLARAGKLIDAIKLLRHDFELPLKEAKLLVEDAMRIEAIRATAAALAAPAPVAAPAHVSVSQGAALAAALDALESDATTDQRREAWDRLRDEFYPVAALAPETPAPTEPTR